MKNPYIVVIGIVLALSWLLFTPIKKIINNSGTIMAIKVAKSTTEISTIEKMQNGYEVKPQYTATANEEKTNEAQTQTESIEERVVRKIISKKEDIKLKGYNFFVLSSDSEDNFYIFKKPDDIIDISLGFSDFRFTVNNPELLKILNEIQITQRVLREQREKERILKAIGE